MVAPFNSERDGRDRCVSNDSFLVCILYLSIPPVDLHCYQAVDFEKEKKRSFLQDLNM